MQEARLITRGEYAMNGNARSELSVFELSQTIRGRRCTDLAYFRTGRANNTATAAE